MAARTGTRRLYRSGKLHTPRQLHAGLRRPGQNHTAQDPRRRGSVTTATTAGTGKKTPVAVEKALKPLTASDDAQFWGNPDRGFRSNISGVGVHTIAEQKDMAAYCKELVMKTIGQNKNYPGDDTMVMQNYFYLYAYNNGDISARGLEGIKTFLRVQAEMGIKSQPRFCYMTSMPDPDHEASQETMLRAHRSARAGHQGDEGYHPGLPHLLHRSLGRMAQRRTEIPH